MKKTKKNRQGVHAREKVCIEVSIPHSLHTKIEKSAQTQQHSFSDWIELATDSFLRSGVHASDSKASSHIT